MSGSTWPPGLPFSWQQVPARKRTRLTGTDLEVWVGGWFSKRIRYATGPVDMAGTEFRRMCVQIGEDGPIAHRLWITSGEPFRDVPATIPGGKLRVWRVG